MTILKVEAQNFRAFKSLTAEFNPKFNILCGPNGAGKSSVLYAIAHGLVLSGNESGLTEETALKLIFTGRYGREKQSGFARGTFKYTGYQNSDYDDYFKINAHPAYHNTDRVLSPLFIGPNRNITYNSVTGMKKESDLESSRKQCLDKAMERLGNAYVPDIKQWMVNRFFIVGKDWAATEEKNWDLVISKLSILTESDIDFAFNTIERDLEPSFLVNGKKTYLEELSSGFKSVLAIIFSIVEWIETTNEGDEANIEQAKGTVLIDEIDAHLHPSWQIRIKGILQELFPHVQFIVTTHSPHVISSAGEGEVGMLENKDGHLTVNFVDHDITAWKTEYIFSDIMAFEPEYDRKLAGFIDDIEDKIDENDLDGAMSILDGYAKHAHPQDMTPRALRKRIEKLQKRMTANDQAE